MISTATNILILTGWVAALVFVLRFVRVTWYRRTAGVLTIAFILTAFGVLSLAALTTLFGRDWAWREPTRFLVYGAINVLLWGCVVLLFKDQRAAHRERQLDDSVPK